MKKMNKEGNICKVVYECPVCKSENTAPLFSMGKFDVYQCIDCSALFVSEMPTEGKLKKYYDSIDQSEEGMKNGHQSYDAQTECTLDFVKKILLSLDTKRSYQSILDIGCGYGTHLGLANELGWKCFGVELSDHARSVAIERHGNHAFITSDIDELIAHKFDVILMLDVIEHLPDPYKIFYSLFAKGAIREDTIIVITTPNAQSLDAISKKEAWEYMHPPSHLIYYSAEALHQFFTRLKFKNIEISGQYQAACCEQSSNSSIFPRNDKVAKNVGLIAKVSGSDFTRFMQERYVPGTWSVLAEYEHMPRYVLAKKYCVGKKVLDFGCGTGYGSKMLSCVASHVTALDIDKEGLQWARNTHSSDNLRFIQSETLGGELSDNSFDVIVNFEMIEHVDEALQKECLRQFSRLLKKSGFLLISTPNPEVTAKYGDNPYHIHEMTKNEFEAFLKGRFEHVAILEQFINPAVIIRSESCELDRHFVGASHATAYIACAAQSKLPDLLGLEYIDANYDFVDKELRKAEVLQRSRLEAYQYFSFLEAKEEKITAHSSQITVLEGILKCKDEAITTQSMQINELHGVLKAKDEAIVSQSIQINKLQGVLKDKNERIDLGRSKIQAFTLELKALKMELLHLKRSRLYLLGQAWRAEFPIMKKAWISGLLIGGGVTPGWLKKIVRDSYKPHKLVAIDSEKKVVLHVIANFFLGGSSRLVADVIYGSFDKYHHEVLTSAVPKEPVYSDIPVHTFSMGFNPQSVADFIDNFSPDLVHIHYWGDCDEPWYDAVYQLIKDRNCKIIENINTPVDPYIGGSIDRYVYVSDYVKREFGQDDQKSLTIYPGSDFDLFKRSNIHDVSDDCIGMVYRLENDKLNLDSIQPFIETVKKRPQTKVIIVGAGTNLAAYKKACKDASVFEAFTFTGYVPYETLPEWYSKLSVFVAPVWKESFGQVSPFAMSMGVPVVGYDIGAISEIIGTHDLLAQYGDSSILADIIVALLDDREKRLKIGDYNQRRAKEKFSIKAMTASYKKLYAELLKVER